MHFLVDARSQSPRIRPLSVIHALIQVEQFSGSEVESEVVGAFEVRYFLVEFGDSPRVHAPLIVRQLYNHAQYYNLCKHISVSNKEINPLVSKCINLYLMGVVGVVVYIVDNISRGGRTEKIKT